MPSYTYAALPFLNRSVYWAFWAPDICTVPG